MRVARLKYTRGIRFASRARARRDATREERNGTITRTTCTGREITRYIHARVARERSPSYILVSTRFGLFLSLRRREFLKNSDYDALAGIFRSGCPKIISIRLDIRTTGW